VIKRHEYANYQEYVDRQVAANKAKIDRVWVKRESIEAIAAYLLLNTRWINFGICHGTRRGPEQQWFREALNCRVIGTEISDTAGDFPDTVQHDFHTIREDWLGKADFVYSNSLDHAYDPQVAVNAWVETLTPAGLCVIEWSDHHGPEYVNQNDPFGASVPAMVGLIRGWGHKVREVLDLPDAARRSKAIVVARK
jgi:hypothetical protein